MTTVYIGSLSHFCLDDLDNNVAESIIILEEASSKDLFGVLSECD